MAVERLDINLGGSALEAEGRGLTAGSATSRSGPRSWLASMLGLRWGLSGRVAHRSPSLPRSAESPAVPHVVLTARSEVTQLENLPVRLSMHGVLSAWREADRALRTFDEGSPEWAAVNATRLALRASYLARFDEYQADDASS